MPEPGYLSPAQYRLHIEWFVLAPLVVWPRENAWELDGLSPQLFSDHGLRVVAEVLCDLRNRGRYVHHKRVARAAERRLGPIGRYIVEGLGKIGTSGNLTHYVSELHRLAKGRAA